MNSLLSYFERVPVLAALSVETQKRLERIAEQRQYRRRQIVHFADQPGDYIYLLCTGRVKIARVSDQGRELTLYMLEECELFGETGLTGTGHTYDVVAETLEESLIAVLRRSEVLAALHASPQAALELLALVSARRLQVEDQVSDLVFLEVPRRLAKLILRLGETHSERSTRGGHLIKAKFTHQEFANIIGSTRETTTLILNDFKRQGMIDFLGRKIMIRDRTALESVVSGASAFANGK